MKKIIFVLGLFFISSLCLSQETMSTFGVSTYVYPASFGIRFAWFDIDQWSVNKVDSANHIASRHLRAACEFRTTFASSFSGEGNVIMVQPELNAVFRLNGSPKFSRNNESINVSFLSGIGVAFGYMSQNDNYFGAYVPMVTEFCPKHFDGALSIKVEGDILYKRYPNYSSIAFRPLVGVVYNFNRYLRAPF